MRAVAQRHAGEALVVVAVVQRCVGRLHDRHGCPQQLPAVIELDLAVAVGQQPVVANALEAHGQHMSAGSGA